jgi:large subunit ribosomal protein L30
MARTFVWHRTRGPKATPKEVAPTGGQVEVKQIRSGIGHASTMRATLEALGLKRMNQTVTHTDTAALRGQIKKVRHLVQVTPVKS